MVIAVSQPFEPEMYYITRDEALADLVWYTERDYRTVPIAHGYRVIRIGTPEQPLEFTDYVDRYAVEVMLRAQ